MGAGQVFQDSTESVPKFITCFLSSSNYEVSKSTTLLLDFE